MKNKSFWICVLFLLIVSSSCAPKPEYYPRYCLAVDTTITYLPEPEKSIMQNLPAGKQVFPGLEQFGEYVMVEYIEDDFGTLNGYVLKSSVVKCHR